MGRPSAYSDLTADCICDRLMDGESLRTISKTANMPNMRTVLRWLEEREDFAVKYARAREIQAEALFEDMQEVADTGNPDDVQRARLRVATMQWRASKLAPKKYGDAVQMKHTDGDGGPLTVVINKPA